MSAKLGRIYKRCKKCQNYMPRKIYDKVSKKSVLNKNDMCKECSKEKQKVKEE